MAIRLQIKSPTFEATAQFHVPGSQTKEKIKFRFKYFGKKQLAELQKEMVGKSDVETIMMFTETWVDDLTVPGEPVEFNKENLEIFLDSYHDAINVLINTYYDELLGARVGN